MTHAIVGAAVAGTYSTHPVIGFSLGFVSHFLVDAIPHGHYRLLSKIKSADWSDEDMRVRSKEFVFDLLRIGLDGFLGLALAIILFSSSISVLQSVFWGAIGGIAPDSLQFAYWKLRREPLISLQKFHMWIHTKKKLDGRPYATIIAEFAVIIMVIILNKVIVR